MPPKSIATLKSPSEFNCTFIVSKHISSSLFYNNIFIKRKSPLHLSLFVKTFDIKTKTRYLSCPALTTALLDQPIFPLSRPAVTPLITPNYKCIGLQVTHDTSGLHWVIMLTIDTI